MIDVMLFGFYWVIAGAAFVMLTEDRDKNELSTVIAASLLAAIWPSWVAYKLLCKLRDQ